MCHINDQHIQCILLAQANLTFMKVFKLALAMETAYRNSKDLEKASGIHSVWTQNKLAGQRRGPTTSSCYHYGGPHLVSVCQFKDNQGHHCGKKGTLPKRAALNPSRMHRNSHMTALPLKTKGELRWRTMSST